MWITSREVCMPAVVIPGRQERVDGNFRHRLRDRRRRLQRNRRPLRRPSSRHQRSSLHQHNSPCGSARKAERLRASASVNLDLNFAERAGSRASGLGERLENHDWLVGAGDNGFGDGD